jgi:hypothetical protein
MIYKRIDRLLAAIRVTLAPSSLHILSSTKEPVKWPSAAMGTAFENVRIRHAFEVPFPLHSRQSRSVTPRRLVHAIAPSRELTMTP